MADVVLLEDVEQSGTVIQSPGTFSRWPFAGLSAKPSTEGSILSQAITKNDSVSTQFQVPAQPTGYKISSVYYCWSVASTSQLVEVFSVGTSQHGCVKGSQNKVQTDLMLLEKPKRLSAETLLFFPSCLICSDIETQYKQCNKKCENAEESEGFEEEEKEASGGVEEGTSSHSTSFYRQQHLKVVFFRCKAETCPHFLAQQTDS